MRMDVWLWIGCVGYGADQELVLKNSAYKAMDTFVVESKSVENESIHSFIHSFIHILIDNNY